MVRLSFLVKEQWKDKPMLNGPVSIVTTFFMPIPKSLSIKKQVALNGKYHIKKVDLDNLEKAFFDVIVMSGVIIKDDCQIAYSESNKIYSDNPRTEATITELEQPTPASPTTYTPATLIKPRKGDAYTGSGGYVNLYFTKK